MPPDNTAAAIATAEAAAALGVSSARIGYQLTNQALQESGAVAVFPLLLVELAAIGESFAAYAATDANARIAEANAHASAARADARWNPSSA